MIHQVDRALESFLRREVPLAEASVDLSFRAPEGSWTASLSRPTVDVFLWEIARSNRSASAGLDQRLTEDGRRQQRPSPTQVALRYFLTVWTREQRDEHELLGALLRCVLGHDTMPLTPRPAAVAEPACRLMLGGEQHRLPAQLWGGAPIKPGLYLDVELGVDAIGWLDRGAPVEALHLGVADAAPEPPVARPASPTPPPLRRSRAGGAIVMEGRAGAGDANGAGATAAGTDAADHAESDT